MNYIEAYKAEYFRRVEAGKILHRYHYFGRLETEHEFMVRQRAQEIFGVEEDPIGMPTFKYKN